MAIAVTWRYMLTLLVVSLGSSLQYCSMAVVNAPQTTVEAWLNRTYFERNGAPISTSTLTSIWSVLASSVFVGACAGALTTRTLAERCGRRNGLTMVGVNALVGALCELVGAYSALPELLIFGRLVLGVSLGVASGLAPMYVMEISAVRTRGTAGALYMVGVASGDLIGLLLGQHFLFGRDQLWPLAFAFPALPALLLVTVVPFLPKSPRYLLITKGDCEEARKAIEFFSAEQHIQETFDALVRAADLELRSSNPFRVADLFRAAHLRIPTLIAIMIMVAQRFSGFLLLAQYSTDILLRAHISSQDAQYATLILGVVFLLCVLPSLFLIERLGRRFLCLFQLTGCASLMTVLSLFLILHRYGPMVVNELASYGCVLAMFVFVAFYGVGSPIAWTITSELFAQEHRSAAVALSTFVSWSLAFCVSLTYLPLQKAIGADFSFLPFILVLCAVTAVLALVLPETKNRPIDDILTEFRIKTVSQVVVSRLKIICHINSASDEQVRVHFVKG